MIAKITAEGGNFFLSPRVFQRLGAKAVTDSVPGEVNDIRVSKLLLAQWCLYSLTPFLSTVLRCQSGFQ